MKTLVKRILIASLVLIVLAVAALALTLRLRYGGGEVFPDRTTAPEFDASQLETVANLDTPPGNIAVSADGRVFVTLHPEARPEIKVAEIVQGKTVPYPDMSFQTGADNPRRFLSVLSLRIDRQNRLWTLDNAHHGSQPGRLLAFDLATAELVHEYVFPKEVAGLGSHLNDFQVSADGRHIFIADASFFAKTPALIVYDIESGTTRRLLEGQASVIAEPYIPVVQDRPMVAFGLVAIRPGVDSIALDHRGEWLYFAPVTNNHMYRILARDLLDTTLAPETLALRVENYALKTMSDGITMDLQDNIYISDPEHSAIVRLDTQRRLSTLIKDPLLRWPDGFSFGPDGWLYVTCSSLHQVIGLPPSSVRKHAPYQVFRFRPGIEGVPGH